MSSQSRQQPLLSGLLVIVPARNEEQTLVEVLPKLISMITTQVVVVDNGSTDRTTEVAQRAGSIVVQENRLGYGSTCLAGIRYVASLAQPPACICFFDGDGQSWIEDVIRVARPVLSHKLSYNQGSRMVLPTSKIALTPAARVANRFFAWILSRLWKQQITDLGPLRCISWKTLIKLNMTSKGYGWTTEMSAKLLKAGIPHHEVPVHYKKRMMGQSKISGSVKTALHAAFVMGLTLLRVMIFWRPPSAN